MDSKIQLYYSALKLLNETCNTKRALSTATLEMQIQLVKTCPCFICVIQEELCPVLELAGLCFESSSVLNNINLSNNSNGVFHTWRYQKKGSV